MAILTRPRVLRRTAFLNARAPWLLPYEAPIEAEHLRNDFQVLGIVG